MIAMIAMGDRRRAYSQVISERAELSSLILKIVDELGVFSIPDVDQRIMSACKRLPDGAGRYDTKLQAGLLSRQNILELKDRSIDGGSSVVDKDRFESREDLLSDRGLVRQEVFGTLNGRDRANKTKRESRSSSRR